MRCPHAATSAPFRTSVAGLPADQLAEVADNQIRGDIDAAGDGIAQTLAPSQVRRFNGHKVQLSWHATDRAPQRDRLEDPESVRRALAARTCKERFPRDVRDRPGGASLTNCFDDDGNGRARP